jgi:iron complex transport system permease protein
MGAVDGSSAAGTQRRTDLRLPGACERAPGDREGGKPVADECDTALDPAGRRRGIGLLASAAALLMACVLSLAIGTQSTDPATVWRAVTDFSDIGNQWVVHDLRVPRTLLGVTVGIALGLSGAMIQGITRNPLADTQILGINSGAGLFVVASIAFLGLRSVWSYIWFAFLGAFVAMVLVYLIAMTGRALVTPVRMLLAGVAVGAVLEGISYTIRLRNPRAFDAMRFWDAGALDGRPLPVTAAVAPFVVIGLCLCLYASRGLNAIALGDDLAVAMGGNVIRTRAVGLVAVTLLAGAATAGAGPIGFVGLMVPHAVRWFIGPDWRWIGAYCVFLAPALLLAADVLGRVVVPPGELPAGIVTAFVGAPVLIWLVRRGDAAGL